MRGLRILTTYGLVALALLSATAQPQALEAAPPEWALVPDWKRSSTRLRCLPSGRGIGGGTSRPGSRRALRRAGASSSWARRCGRPGSDGSRDEQRGDRAPTADPLRALQPGPRSSSRPTTTRSRVTRSKALVCHGQELCAVPRRGRPGRQRGPGPRQPQRSSSPVLWPPTVEPRYRDGRSGRRPPDRLADFPGAELARSHGRYVSSTPDPGGESARIVRARRSAAKGLCGPRLRHVPPRGRRERPPPHRALATRPIT